MEIIWYMSTRWLTGTIRIVLDFGLCNYYSIIIAIGAIDWDFEKQYYTNHVIEHRRPDITEDSTADRHDNAGEWGHSW